MAKCEIEASEGLPRDRPLSLPSSPPATAGGEEGRERGMLFPSCVVAGSQRHPGARPGEPTTGRKYDTIQIIRAQVRWIWGYASGETAILTTVSLLIR